MAKKNQITERNWRSEVERLLDEKINELFCEIQEGLGIRYGDINPSEAFALDEAQDAMSELIVKIIAHEYENELEDRESEKE